MKILLKVKKHQYYLYVSILLIVLFFIGNSLITPKITSVSEELIEDVVQGNLEAKENIVAFEFSKLNSFLSDAHTILENSTNLSEEQLKQKLFYTSELAISNDNIENSFVFLVEDEQISDSEFLNNSDAEYIEEIYNLYNQNNKFQQNISIDIIVNDGVSVLNRKLIIYKLDNASTVVVGYDINLIKFWNYFSENYQGEGGYTVLTNIDGVCLLHPEPEYIGKEISSFFSEISLNEVLNNSNQNVDLVQTKVTSEYLNLEVLRYFKEVTIGNNSLILIVSFPVDIYLKESIVDIKRYFSWISILAFITFMLLLGISRLQLRKEFYQNLKFAKEKEKLASSNEKYQRENAELQLNQLKRKMNPHFLFNSLNSLHVLIGMDTDLSQQFVLKLADVYRYLLEDRDGNLTSVKNELNFLKQYFFLQEIRFRNSLNLSIKYDCDNSCLMKKIPFLALETLVENAIKHNEITKQKPLFIEIVITNENIIVTNNYNPRKNKENNSHHIGLKYLKNNYQYYQINSFKTEIIDEKFKCYLPLLQ